MKKRSIAVAATILGGAGIAAVLLVATGPEPRRAPHATTAPLVEVAPLERGSADIEAEAFGVVRPARRTELSPQVAGRIVELHPALRPGGVIREGEVVVRIDASDYEIALAEAEAALADARAAYRIQEGEQAVAAQEWKEFGPVGDASDAGAALARREPQLRRAAAQVAAAKARRDRARLDLERTEIRAPFDATVLERSADLGQAVGPNTVVANLAGTSEFWIEATLPPDRASAVAEGAAVEVELQSGLSNPVRREGRVLNRISALDQNGRLARVLVAVDDPLGLDGDGAELSIGSYVRLEIPAGRARDVYVIPRASLGVNGSVWVRDGEGRLASRDVDIVWRRADEVLARADFADGDMLVTSPLSSPTPGVPVRVREGAPGSSGEEPDARPGRAGRGTVSTQSSAE